MRMNTNNQPIKIDDTTVDDVKHFIYLHVDATVSETGGTNEDIRRRLGHARLAYNKLKSVWNNSQFGRKTKMKLLKSNVLSVLLSTVKVLFFVGMNFRGLVKNYTISWIRTFVDFVFVPKIKFVDFIFST